MNKTIERAKTVVLNRIEHLNKKIDQVDERWPYEMYGLKGYAKKEKYENEIQELQTFLNEFGKTENSMVKAREAENDMFHAKNRLREIARCLSEYGEHSKAEWLMNMVKQNEQRF